MERQSSKKKQSWNIWGMQYMENERGLLSLRNKFCVDETKKCVSDNWTLKEYNTQKIPKFQH